MNSQFFVRRVRPGFVFAPLVLAGVSLVGFSPPGFPQEGAMQADSTASAVPASADPASPDPAGEGKGMDEMAVSDAELLGPPLVVNGVTVSADAIKRQLVLSGSGGTLFELAKLREFIKREIDRQVADEGRSPEDFIVDESEITTALEEAREQVAAQFEGQNVTLEDVYPDINSPAWLDNLRLTKLFRRVFLPPNPNDYPPLTVTAIKSGKEGEALYGALVEQYETLQAKQAAAGPDAPEPTQDPGQQFMDMLMQQTVVAYLTDNADIKMPEDGIPDHLMAIVDGKEITVDEIWQQVRHEIGPMDVWRAKQWFVNTMAAEKALKEADAWISREEANKRYEEYAAPYKESFVSIPKIATVIKKFPTLGNYKQYYQIQESFLELRGDQMTDEALNEQGDRKTSYLVSQAKVDVDIILLSAYDFKTKSWKENGWAEAERRAKEVAQKLAAGEDWDRLLDEYSDFYDQPIPTAAQNSPDLKLKNKGRFRGMSRNDLLRQLEESDFSMFLSGFSITDMIFFDQVVGGIENPVKGPHGWYITRLLRKTPPTRRLSASNEKDRPYLVQDWTADNLNRFVQEAVANSEISGL